MSHQGLLAARTARGWTQHEAAGRLEVSESYLAMLEAGVRPLTRSVARRAVRTYGLSPVTVPLPRELDVRVDPDTLARDLAALGYPAMAQLSPSPETWEVRNPAKVLLAALAQDTLEARLVEALPWLLLQYPEVDLDWLVRQAKLRDLQNRLGFVVSLARELAQQGSDATTTSRLRALETTLDRSRLVREDTLGRASMPEAERTWLRQHRPEAARHWNLLTDWRADMLRHAR